MKGDHVWYYRHTVISAELGDLFAVTLGKSLHLSGSVFLSGKRREKSNYMISEVSFSSNVASLYFNNLIKYL